MKRRLIVILAVCMLAAAFAPRDRRAVNTEEDEERLRNTSLSSICPPNTPCQWVIYNKPGQEMSIMNTYCHCGSDKTCEFYEDSKSIQSYVYHCKELSAQVEDTTSGDS